MNERIDKIAQESRDYAGGYWDEYSPEWLQFYNEKFAELIVRECAGIDFRHKVGLTHDDDYAISKVIREYFGVK